MGKMGPIKNQKRRGACVAFATCAPKEFQENKQPWNKGPMDLSEEFIYRQIRIKGLGGAYPREAMKLLVKRGVCREGLMPYNDRITSDSQEKPFTLRKYRRAVGNARKHRAQGYVRLNSLAQIKESLVVNGPCLLGLSWLSGWLNLRNAKSVGGFPVLHSSEGEVVGGHAICIVGYDDTKRVFIIRNSWGTSWGRKGYALLSYDALGRNYDAWATFDWTNPLVK